MATVRVIDGLDVRKFEVVVVVSCVVTVAVWLHPFSETVIAWCLCVYMRRSCTDQADVWKLLSYVHRVAIAPSREAAVELQRRLQGTADELVSLESELYAGSSAVTGELSMGGQVVRRPRPRLFCESTWLWLAGLVSLVCHLLVCVSA